MLVNAASILFWEITQSIIAFLVTGTGMYVAAILSLRSEMTESEKGMTITAFLLLSNTLFLVIGFYFGRTNHVRTGGPGGSKVIEHR